MSDFESKISEDNLSAQLSGSSIHMLADALTSCFKGSGAINHLECSFEDPDDGEQYTLLMQKRSGITQGEKISSLQEENAQQRESLDAFRELVKVQTQTMNELNEKCKKQSKLIKELTYESGGQWYTGLHGDSDITDIVGDLLD